MQPLRMEPRTPNHEYDNDMDDWEPDYRHNSKHPFNMLVPDGPLANADKVDSLFERTREQVQGAFCCLTAVLGDKLGLYKAMDGSGPMKPAELAFRTGTSERYCLEWLSAQAAAGFVNYKADEKTFELSPEQAQILARDDNEFNLMGLMEMAVGLAGLVDGNKLADAFKAGRGVGWSEQPLGVIRGIARTTSTEYEAHLVQDWLPSLSDSCQLALEAGGRVADVGCGFGATTLLLSMAYPESQFCGIDCHELSIEQARKLASNNGIKGNVNFEIASSTDFPGTDYAMVACFDSLHDMGDPAGAARHIYTALSDGGSWMIVEHASEDRLEDNIENPTSQILYPISAMVCVPSALSQSTESAAWGACVGESRLRGICKTAGFKDFKLVAQTYRHRVYEAKK